jgi:NitT/TauT family transport system substrate-binding protein
LTRPATEAFAIRAFKRIDQHPRRHGNAGSQLTPEEGSVTPDRAVTLTRARVSPISRRLALAGAGALALPHIARAADKLTVKLDFFPWGLHAAMHVANVNGWFRDAGLEVDVQDGRGSANTLQLVNAGQFDVGQIQVGLLSQAAAGGATLKAFAGFMRATDLSAIVPLDSPMTKVADFRGKSLVVFAASPWMPFVDLWLKEGGLNRDMVTLMLVDPAALFGTYTSGRADALLTPAGAGLPFTQKPRPSRAIMASDAGIVFPSYGLVATDAVLRSKADALRRLVKVQQHTWSWLGDGHIDEGVAAMIAQRPDARLDPDIMRAQAHICLTLFNTPSTAGKPIGWQSETDWESCIATQVAAGVVKPGLKPADFYTNELIA